LFLTFSRLFDLASPVRFTELVGNYVENLGIGRSHAEQVRGLQDWINGQQSLEAP